MTEEHEHDLHGMVKAVTERTKVLFLCSPNNPTGNRLSHMELRRLLSLGLPTVIDEAYVEFDGDSEVTLLADFPNAIVLRTFSKAYGLAGMRLGYALAHAEVIRLFERVKVPWNLPSVTLAAAAAALEETSEHRARLEELRDARESFQDRLRKIPGVSVTPSDGNFLLLDVSRTGMTAEGVVSGVFREGVLMRSLAVHHANKHFVRVTVGTEEQNRRCAGALSRVVQARLSSEPMARAAPELSDAE
jgi:histidinol-phosphate aminotransferase